MKAFILVAALALIQSAGAAVFQYAMLAETRKGERMAFLWIPPRAESVDGIVIGGMTLMEREMAKDTRIRKACAAENLAIVFLKCGLQAIDLQVVLDGLAEKSGYAEIARAPLLFVGHSADGPQAKERAREWSERCIGLVQYRGADPGGDEPVPPGIPSLMMIGQFDEFGKIGRDANGIENWEKDRDKMAAYRSANPRNLGSIVVEPGAGHFAWSARNAEYLALFIQKAARTRIPNGWALGGERACRLKSLDPGDGWLTDLDIRSGSTHPSAPYADYAGEKPKAAWHFDRQMTDATVAYHNGIRRKDQFIVWKDPHRVNAGARNFFTQVEWLGDGQSFAVHPAYADSYPRQSGGRGSVWGDAGRPAARSSAPIRVKPVSGPIVLTGRHTLRIRFDALAPATEKARVTFMAFSEGDDEFRYTERVGMLDSEHTAIRDGRQQKITFPPIGDLKAGGEIPLRAASDSELPVEYYVAFGPGLIEGDRLRVSDLPARAKFPISLKVVAYQCGRQVEPFVQAASPVEQTISIVQP